MFYCYFATRRVSLEKEEPSVLRVTGVVVDSKLQLLRYDTDLPLNCVSFDKTYYGTDVVRSAVLFNNSPESLRFVMILNDTVPAKVHYQWQEGHGELSPLSLNFSLSENFLLVRKFSHGNTKIGAENLPVWRDLGPEFKF